MTSLSGLVCNIQRFSLHDGPGIRTTVFLKGCTLRCFWCHNPESIRLTQELRLYPDRCIGCGACVEVCPTGAQGLSPEGELQFDRERCQACGACVEVCFAGARELSARRMTVPEVVAEVLQDRAFYESSRGGVTLSGGEPALQPEFSYEILAQCREAGVHTAIETAANVRWENLARLMPVTDMVMMDLKQMDPQKHRWATGASNALLLANARRLVETGKPIIFRTPVVPTVNDTPEEIAAIAAFVREMVLLRRARGDADGDGVGEDTITLELLPFHRLAGDKYRSLGLVMEALTATAAEQGITVHHR